jgi:hypothetical protein
MIMSLTRKRSNVKLEGDENLEYLCTKERLHEKCAPDQCMKEDDPQRYPSLHIMNGNDEQA